MVIPENAPHILRNVTISLVAEAKPIDVSILPFFMSPHVHVFREGQRMLYRPIMFFNDFWILKEQFEPVKSDPIEITVEFQPISFMKFQVICQMDFSFKQQGNTSDYDDIKRMFSDTSPILIAITFTVSILHSLFDFLAFKNGIIFYSN